VARAVREGARETHHDGFLRPALVVGEVGLCLVLLVGAALLLSSLHRLRGVEEGLDTENVLTVTLSAFRPGAEETRIRNVTSYYRLVIEKLKELPGVVAVGGTDKFPYGARPNERRDFRLELRGESEEERTHRGATLAIDVTPEYFQAVGIPLLEGRAFHDADTLDAPWVVILSATASERLFPGRSPIGQEVRIAFDGGGGDPWARVVGVVGDVKYQKREDGTAIEIYYPYTQYGLSWTTLAIRTRGRTAGLAERVREAVHSVDPETAVEDIQEFSTLIDGSLWREKLWGTLLSSFGALALVLAATGLYGVVSYAVTSRTREIGVRMALGSRPKEVVSLVTGSGMRLVGAGLAIGLIAAALLVPLIRSVLFEADELSLIAYGVPTLVLAAIALAACVQPAIRASRIDPIRALRQD
jgi:predicted permease